MSIDVVLGKVPGRPYPVPTRAQAIYKRLRTSIEDIRDTGRISAVESRALHELAHDLNDAHINHPAPQPSPEQEETEVTSPLPTKLVQGKDNQWVAALVVSDKVCRPIIEALEAIKPIAIAEYHAIIAAVKLIESLQDANHRQHLEITELKRSEAPREA